MLTALLEFSVYVEVGDFGTIDAIAYKSESKAISLVMFQLRPRNEKTFELIGKKSGLYKYFIQSGLLLKQVLDAAGKKTKLILAYEQIPNLSLFHTPCSL